MSIAKMWMAQPFIATTGHLGPHCRILLRLGGPPLANVRSAVSQPLTPRQKFLNRVGDSSVTVCWMLQCPR